MSIKGGCPKAVQLPPDGGCWHLAGLRLSGGVTSYRKAKVKEALI